MKPSMAKFTPVERTAYEDSLKYCRDLKNSLDTSFEEGKTEGVEIGLEIGLEKGQQIGLEIGMEQGQQIGLEIGKREKAVEIAQKCLSKGMDIAEAADLSGLGVEEIAAISQILKTNSS